MTSMRPGQDQHSDTVIRTDSGACTVATWLARRPHPMNNPTLYKIMLVTCGRLGKLTVWIPESTVSVRHDGAHHLVQSAGDDHAERRTGTTGPGDVVQGHGH